MNFETLGNPVDEVSLGINYEIIQHFSRHLYSSPNKAIEELVANGFDAFAQWVHVFIPGIHTNNRVIVWDNGLSMGVEELKGLWVIAESPKQDIEDRTMEVDGATRKLIGKFGIGKLASYTVGNTIAHLCRRNNDFLLVAVDYNDVTNQLQSSTEDSYKSPIRQLDEHTAYSLVTSQFTSQPDDCDTLFNESSWTFALIAELKTDRLTSGRLRWVLGNGMPHRPDFKVWVNGEEVEPKLKKSGIVAGWTLGSNEVKTNLRNYWREALAGEEEEDHEEDDEEKSHELIFDKELGLDYSDPSRKVEYVKFPLLGKVWGDVRLYERSLLEHRFADHGRSHGFFVMVRDRLLNSDDDKLFLPEPEFGAFYRSQYVLHIDALDEDLLADRERLKEDTERINELKLLQRAVYQVTRLKRRELAEALAQESSLQSRLPTHSLEYFADPFTALWARRKGSVTPSFDVRNPPIDVESLGEDSPVSDLASDDRGFLVNDAHPYYRSLEEQFGGRRKREVLREFELLAISEQLFEGFLYEIGLPDEKIRAIVRWRDGMYRAIAESNKTKTDRLIRDLREASYRGSKEFEEAITRVLLAMGFAATRQGASGDEDILVFAPVSSTSFKMTVEAKGIKNEEGALSNDDAEVSPADTHRENADADHAIVVARKFVGFKRYNPDDPPMIIQQCRTTDGRISIVDIDALAQLLKVMRRYYFRLDEVLDIFTTIESPQEKLERISQLEQTITLFDYRLLLERIWEEQGSDIFKGDAIPFKNVWARYYRGDYSEWEDFKPIVGSLARLGLPLVYYDEDAAEIALLNSPEHIARLIQDQLEQGDVEIE